MNIYRLKLILGVIMISAFLSGCAKGANDMVNNDAKITPVKGKITFTSDRRGGCLFLLKDGKMEMLTHEGGHGRFSTDGNKIYFRITGEIFVYDLSNNKINTLDEITQYKPVDFDLSPDNKQIVFSSFGQKFDYDIPENIYVVNMDGTGYKQLTFFASIKKGWNAAGAARPRWSPDGKTIVFTGPDIIGRSWIADAIYTIAPDGTDLKKIIGPGEIYNPCNPSWSPDSKKIVFQAELKNDKQGHEHIYAEDMDGSNPKKTIVGYSYIFISDADGSNIRQVTTKKFNDSDPVFSPDGRQICFVSHRHYVKDEMPNALDSELYVIDIDGANEIRITPPELLGKYNISPHLGSYANDSSPDWHE
ncbi:MAG: hypothetical protein V1933_04710 [Candidatus Omnitrophota bacterium]